MCVYKCTACACASGARESMLVVALYPSHLGTYLGQLSYLFVLYALLPGVAVQI